MKKYQIEQGDYFISSDFLRTLKEKRAYSDDDPFWRITHKSKEIAQEWADAVTNDIYEVYPEIKEYQELYGKLTELEGIAILDAHGSIKNGDWNYIDGKQKRPVQNWINKHDGKYNSLVLFSCYIEHKLNLISRKSLLIIPDRKIGFDDGILGPIISKVYWTLFDPRIGELTTYDYEPEIKQMKKQLRERKK